MNVMNAGDTSLTAALETSLARLRSNSIPGSTSSLNSPNISKLFSDTEMAAA